MSSPYTRGAPGILGTRFVRLLTTLMALGCLLPSFAAATAGETTAQNSNLGILWLSPHNPLGGDPWFSQTGLGPIFEFNEKFETTKFEISGTNHGKGDLTQGSDGNVYFTITDNEFGLTEPAVVGRLVTSSGSSSYLTLPTAPSNCAEFTSPIPECGIDLANGPGNTVWYTQFKQKEGEHVAKVGKIAVSEAGTPITQYSLSNPETQPSGIIEGGGSRMWFLQKFGIGQWPAVTYNLVKSKLNKEGKLEISEYAIPNKAPGELVRDSGENVFLFQNVSANHRIVKITPEGKTTEISIGAGAEPQGPALGPDGNIWFVEREAKKIGRLTPGTGAITRFSTLNPTGCNPLAVIRGFKESMLVRESCPSEFTKQRLSVVATK